MMLLGPTESLVIADDSADVMRPPLTFSSRPNTEPTPQSFSCAIVNARSVDAELHRQLADLPEVRATAARAVLGPNGGCVVVDNIDDACTVANAYAPEHLQIDSRDRCRHCVDQIDHAGEMLIGHTTVLCSVS